MTDDCMLASGRQLSANCGILGIGPGGAAGLDGLAAYEGYDGVLEGQRDGESCASEMPLFTADERREIADRAIAMWNEWAALDRSLGVQGG
jgi:hypothetical protein